MVLLLPMYYTVQCNPLKNGRAFCAGHALLTDFEQLTIANVLPQTTSEIVFTNGTTVAQNNTYFTASFNNETLSDIDVINSAQMQWISGITGE